MSDIKIRYEISGVIKSNLKEGSGTIKIPTGTSARTFLQKFAGISDEHIKYMYIAINDKKSSLDMELKDGDELLILLPIGGGTDFL